MMAVALVVLTIAIYSASFDHRHAAKSVPTTERIGDHAPEAVRGLLSFVDSMRAGGSAAGGRELAAVGVRHVAAALGAVANSTGLNIDAELETIREHATQIERDPRSRERTAQARAAFRALAVLFEAVQQARFRGLGPDVANVSRAASSLRPKYRLVDQDDVVQEFFIRAASAIRAMNHEMSSPHQASDISTA